MVSMPSRRLLVRLLLAVLAGALAALGLAPVGWWGVTLAVLLGLPALVSGGLSARQQGAVGWALGLGYFLHGLFWIMEPFQVDAARHGWMAPFALVFMAGGMALFWGAAFWGAARIGRSSAGRIWALVLLWALASFARAYLFTGFPWGALAQIWVDTDVALLLAWLGPHGLTLLTLAATLPTGMVLCGLATPHRRANMPHSLPVLALVLSVGAVTTLPPTVTMTDHVVRLVQPNAPQNEKWDPTRIPVFYERQLAYTAAAPRPDLIVWPETAIPWLLDDAGPALEEIAAAAAGAPVVLGVQRDERARYYNAMVYLDATGAVAGVYDKHHLVPFGEYIPFGDLAAQFGLHGFAAQEGAGYSAGPGPVQMPFGALGQGVPLICYEAVFPQDVGGAGGRADFLIQITNDAWFGQNSGPYQHLVQARMRAIEQGLPMIRAANTGISAMIDPLGRVSESIPLGQAGYLDAKLPAPLAPTLYARLGDMPILALLSLALAALWFRQLRKGGVVLH
ncbi:apolipoprotein N-acyltransferase [Pontibaca salina]|uniref:Apolipoprotein N-acyltransferase n=1 Tax=Pontibaca salina TaxID=2795731 RepID=A0A934LYR1_9RHOB|nr:apolipoprotein N-acyltransferase [Pontibaca salina]MBI6630057.1 apolipoprotein N-acyltransferase [Pontibaca salina]